MLRNFCRDLQITRQSRKNDAVAAFLTAVRFEPNDIVLSSVSTTKDSSLGFHNLQSGLKRIERVQFRDEFQQHILSA